MKPKNRDELYSALFVAGLVGAFLVLSLLWDWRGYQEKSFDLLLSTVILFGTLAIVAGRILKHPKALAVFLVLIPLHIVVFNRFYQPLGPHRWQYRVGLVVEYAGFCLSLIHI